MSDYNGFIDTALFGENSASLKDEEDIEIQCYLDDYLRQFNQIYPTEKIIEIINSITEDHFEFLNALYPLAKTQEINDFKSYFKKRLRKKKNGNH